MSGIKKWSASYLIFAGVYLALGAPPPAGGAQPQRPTAGGASSGLPLPRQMPLADYERMLYKFLYKRAYAASPLSWAQDKEIRDAGPFIGGLNYGTHPAVRIYYSPEVIDWLKRDRQGPIADGGIIVKEMFSPPAALYLDPVLGTQPRKEAATGASPLDGLISNWTVMVKDSSIARGGWFYSNPRAPGIDTAGKSPKEIDDAIDAYLKVPGVLDSYGPPFDFPASGVALGTCQRCHASAARELTFSSTTNILGFPGEPIRFRNDGTWRDPVYQSFLPENVRNLFAAARSERARGVQAPGGSRPIPNVTLARPLRARTDRDDNLELKRFLALGLHGPQARRALHAVAPATGRGMMRAAVETGTAADPEFLRIFPLGSPESTPNTNPPKRFPGQWADRVVAGPTGSETYITSDNCLGCHGGLGGAPFGLTMFVQTDSNYGHGYNVSEYGEWRWSPMGLAGRDPIFYAQVESERALVDTEVTDPAEAGTVKAAMFNLCLSCHGAMGQRQLVQDAQAGLTSPVTGKRLDPTFKAEYLDLTTALRADDLNQKNYEYHKYGNLAREGVSCTVCHHIDAPDPVKVKASGFTADEYFLMRNLTGRYERGPDNVLNGPIDKVSVLPMEASLGVTPKLNPFIKDSKVCGTCHAINLPNIDAKLPGPFPILNKAEAVTALQKFPHSIEQATFLEWQNSVYARKAEYQSCQDCHMPGKFALPAREKDSPLLVTRDPDKPVFPEKAIELSQVVTQVATIEDTNYPSVDHSEAPDALHVPTRNDYKRHELVGLNVFLEMMFAQFNPVLGVSLEDPMTGPFDTDYANRTDGNVLAIANMVRQARCATVDVAVEILPTPPRPGTIAAKVTVTNKVGHRFPSGVGFRRAFLEVLVTKKSDNKVVWGSGQTNTVGVIVDETGKVLPTEFLPDAKTFQPNYQVVDAQNKVQIYEELSLNAKNEFNTSFVHRDCHPKDNRLLARGWLSNKHLPTDSPIVKEFMDATKAEGKSIEDDPDFSDNDGKGATGVDHVTYVMTLPEGVKKEDVTVKATMYYQAIPPFYLRERFRLAPKGDATRRLHYMTSRLVTKGTPIENWKLRLSSTTVDGASNASTPGQCCSPLSDNSLSREGPVASGGNPALTRP